MSRCGIPTAASWGRIPMVICVLLASSPLRSAPPPLECLGMANASAAVRVGRDRFLVGSDEDNALILYSASTGGRPLKIFETNPWLDLPKAGGEVDFEGAARVGDVLYWIGSHARSRNGRHRPDRQRLLALRISNEDGDVSLTPLGPPVKNLLEGLVSAAPLSPFHLRDAAELAPELPGGLNIEGIAAGPGGGLWIGFRSPVPDGLALVALLKNPADVVAGKPAEWGSPARLNLEGKGIRDLAWTGRDYLVLSGNPADGGRTRLWRWTGEGTDVSPVRAPGLKELNAEALVVFGTPAEPRVLILSDDGNRKGNDSADRTQRSFRMIWADPAAHPPGTAAPAADP